MSNDGMNQVHVQRILAALEEVEAKDADVHIDESLLRRIVELEVEFQYIDDRKPVLVRLREIVDRHLPARTDAPGGDEK